MWDSFNEGQRILAGGLCTVFVCTCLAILFRRRLFSGPPDEEDIDDEPLLGVPQSRGFSTVDFEDDDGDDYEPESYEDYYDDDPEAESTWDEDLPRLVSLGGRSLPDNETMSDMADIVDDISWKENERPRPVRKARAVFQRMADGDSGKMEEKSDLRLEDGYRLVFQGWSLDTGDLCKVSSEKDMRMVSVIEDNLVFRNADRFSSEPTGFRVIGCDTFELAQGFMGEVGRDFAEDFLVGRECEVWIYGVDDYGRLLLSIKIDAETTDDEVIGLDYSKMIVRFGIGIRYAGSKFEEGVWYQQMLDPLQESAEEEGLGYWGIPENERPELPHDYRNSKRRRHRQSRSRRTSVSFAASSVN